MWGYKYDGGGACGDEKTMSVPYPCVCEEANVDPLERQPVLLPLSHLSNTPVAFSLMVTVVFTFEASK